MAKSNKPIVWGPFAAGGTITALLTPVLILLTLLVGLRQVPPGLGYDGLHAFVAHPLAKLLVFAVIALSLWSAAHRLRITFYDFGMRQDGLVAAIVYLVAAAGTIVLVATLWAI
jgi:fumarate reductase subunit D